MDAVLVPVLALNDRVWLLHASHISQHLGSGLPEAVVTSRTTCNLSGYLSVGPNTPATVVLWSRVRLCSLSLLVGG